MSKPMPVTVATAAPWDFATADRARCCGTGALLAFLEGL